MEKKLLAGILFLGGSLLTWAGVDPQTKFAKSGDVFGCRVFIENRGQFDKELKGGEKILYAYQNGDERTFFTDKGVVYLLVKHFPLSERQMEDLEHGRQ